MEHHFNIDLAARFGILEAIILNNLQFWLRKNAANNANFFDGSYWTYNSVHAYAELFPYASEKQIRTALKKLVNAGILKTGNYNKSAYDRTLWYALTDEGLSICPIGKMEEDEKANQNDRQGEPIPYINPNDKPFNKPNKKSEARFVPPTAEEVKEYCNERNNGIDAEYFVDYYAARDWRLKGGGKLKDWKAAVRTWEKRDFNDRKPKQDDSRFCKNESSLEYPF